MKVDAHWLYLGNKSPGGGLIVPRNGILWLTLMGISNIKIWFYDLHNWISYTFMMTFFPMKSWVDVADMIISSLR